MDIKFPNFKKLEITDQHTIEKKLNKYPPYSDHHFTGLWTYDTNSEVTFTFTNNNFTVKTFDYLDKTKKPFLSFIGSNKVEDTIYELLTYAKLNGLDETLRLIPEISIEKHLEKLKLKFVIKEDLDNFDYIIPIDHMTELKGGKLHSNRQRINHFVTNNKNITTAPLDIKNKEVQNLITKCFYEWKSIRNKNTDSIEKEYAAIKRAFDYANYFNFITVGTYINGTLNSYSINEGLDHKIYMGHFGLADPTVLGSIQYMEHAAAVYLTKLGYEFMNYEQDLGIKGLRETKASWAPVGFLKKYTIENIA